VCFCQGIFLEYCVFLSGNNVGVSCVFVKKYCWSIVCFCQGIMLEYRVFFVKEQCWSIMCFCQRIILEYRVFLSGNNVGVSCVFVRE